jgi:hypothetical protein
MADDQQDPQLELPDHFRQMADTHAEADLPHLPHRHPAHDLPPEATAVLEKVSSQHHTHHVESKPDTDNAPLATNASSSLAGKFTPTHQLAVEEIDTMPLPKRTRPGRAMASSAIALAVLIGLAAVWFQFNRGTYSLEPQPDQVADSSPTISANNPATLGAETNSSRTLSLSASLPQLKQGHYQAWVNHAGQAVSLGAFKPAGNNQVQNLDGSAFQPRTTITSQDTLFVTIESGDLPTATPSQTVILTGKLDDQGQAKLAFSAIDLSKASGVFTLATPTSADSDPRTGLWFAQTDGKSLTGPGLNLPTAPAGWKYEGQVVYKGVAVEIGRFSQTNQADEFNKFTTNPDGTPSFPGEDFLQKAPGQLGLEFPTDLTTGEWQVIISVEPDQDGQDPTGSDTFFLQPLKADITQGSQPNKQYPLALNLQDLPTGQATFK